MKEQQLITLDGEWRLASADNSIECPVQVPGSVLAAATEQGMLDDPYYRMNEYPAREFLRQDFIFSRSFVFERREGYTYELCCDGIDTIADIFLNGVLLKSVDNMHLRDRIPCGDKLKDGGNELRIYIHSALNYIEAYEPQPGKEVHYAAGSTVEKNQYIRKAHSMFGWDWGPQLPDMGIWRGIYIRGFAGASLEHVRFRQKHGEGKVTLQAEAVVKLAKEELDFAGAREKMPQLRLELSLLTPEGERIAFSGETCTVAEPKLWWPNRCGEQPLYTVQARLWCGEELLNEKKYRIGLRTLTVSRKKDAWGEEFAFCINGVRIFAKGANYIPEDCIYSRNTPERIHTLLQAAVDCGFNCIRVWGGGYYPSEAFYDFCDEHGLIVWQDFMFACNIYELTDRFKESIIAEVKDNVRRLCHHASLGLWCGNNEMESAWDHWEGFCDHCDALRQDYLTMFEKVIPDALRSEDDVTFYWPSSPSSGGGFADPDSEHTGDCHYWAVWHGEKPFTDYEKYYFRFCSEFGFQSIPCKKTVDSFTLPEDRNLFSEVMESHQKNSAANGKIMRYIADNFLYPKDFSSLIYISQVQQGLAIKEGVEHWRRNRARCMGALYWQLNDNWPVNSWAGIDYYGRWKALQYMARHFFADILGSMRALEGGRYVLCVQNETFRASQSDVHLFVRDMDGSVLFEKTDRIACDPLSAAESEPADLQEYLSGKEDHVFVEAVFDHSDGTCSHQVRMPKPYKHMRLKKAEITCACTRAGDMLCVSLKSSVPAFFVEIETDADMILSDNFMHMTETRDYTVTGKLPDGYEGIPAVRARSLCDSYEY